MARAKTPSLQEVSSLKDLIVLTEDMQDGNWGFRGLASCNYRLLPSIGRPDIRPTGYSKGWEEFMFGMFKLHAVPHLRTLPTNDLNWLAVARHHGLPTRLLDWSLSPLIACYFAVERPHSGVPNDDAMIFSYWNDDLRFSDDLEDPFHIREDVIEVQVQHLTPRITVQKGYFTLHRYPDKEFKPRRHKKFIIRRESCENILFSLDFLGINRATLFPDLDGLGEYLGWDYGVRDG